jgi:hypothetical protein
MPLHGADGDQRVRIPQPAVPRTTGRRAARPREPGARDAGPREAGAWQAAAGRTRHLRLRLCDPARRAEARRLLALVLEVPPLAGVDPAVLIAEVPDSRRAVDVLIELAWSGIELDGFGFDAAV